MFMCLPVFYTGTFIFNKTLNDMSLFIILLLLLLYKIAVYYTLLCGFHSLHFLLFRIYFNYLFTLKNLLSNFVILYIHSCLYL